MELFFLEGLLLGFLVSIPFGPMSIICINNTLHKGRIYGFFSGLGIATADSIYAFISIFSVTTILNFISKNQIYLNILGGIIIFLFGIKTFLKPALFVENIKKINEDSKNSTLKVYLSSFLITITSPANMILFMIVFSAIGVNLIEESNIFSPILIVVGFFFGAICWWVFITYIATYFKYKFNQTFFNRVNKVFGSLMCIFAFLAILKTFI